jgi:hypothetical protein
MMAATKDSTITNNMIVIGDVAIGMLQQQAAEVHLTLYSSLFWYVKAICYLFLFGLRSELA